MRGMSFLAEPAPSPGQQRMYDDDLAQHGYVWSNSRVWSHHPEMEEAFGAALDLASQAAGLTDRERAMLVLGQAKAIGDSYCSVAWSRRLAEWEDEATALAAIRGDEAPFDERERALARWAQTVARDPNGATPDDIQALRDVGFDDAQIFSLTAFTALRVALSTINDALGARPDLALTETIDPEIRAAITWGRPPA